MYGLPEQGKAAKREDAMLERITYYRDELALTRDELTAECARQTRLEWAILYVSTIADLMVNAPEGDRIKFASEIRSMVLELDLMPEPTRHIARPADIEQPPAEGEWLEATAEHVGED